MATTSVCTASLALTGTASPGVSVFVTGAATSIATDAHPSTGKFCMDVPLVKNSVNNFEVRAQDPVLGLSDPVTVAVTHQDCQNDDAGGTPQPQPQSKNVALGAAGIAGSTAKEGNEGFLADGDDTTHAKYCGSWGFWGLNSYNGWVTLKLDKVYKVGKIVVRWRDSKGNGHEYGGKYKVLVSSMSDPGDPDLKNGYWVQVADVTQGDGGEDTFDQTGTEPLVQHVALWLVGDGGGGITSFDDCFAISEIEVWDSPPKTSQAPPTTSSCASIGSGF